MTLKEFNSRNLQIIREDLFKCCGCNAWLNKLMKHYPFQSIEDLKINSDKSWHTCTKEDWLEAFSHHPKIGEKSLDKRNLSSTKEWATQEQSGVKTATQSVLDDLAEHNRIYEENFGYIFIVCATGKTAEEMLGIIKDRLNNDPEKELHIAAGEQNKITHLRIDKLFV